MGKRQKRAWLEAYALGVSIGHHESSAQARKAYEAGQIELWLEWQHPKTMEEWAEFEALYGDHDAMEARWK
jgi:hypothetical protein